MIKRLFAIETNSLDPFENLALEAVLTETVPPQSCILYLWQNQHTVVLGRNQNPWNECRIDLLEQEGGTWARRLSGGGAVYHDLGNLNFTFCLAAEDYDLARQQQVLLEACRELGIPARLSGRNDLTASGRKFSGNSFYTHRGRAFHNGTLLIDADRERLSRYLTPSSDKLKSKGVASVRSRVVNLRELRPDLTVEAMKAALWGAFSRVYGLPLEQLSEQNSDPAQLREKRAFFAGDAWRYGRTLPFDHSFSRRFDWGEVTLQCSVREGRCRAVRVYTDALDQDLADRAAEALEGCKFAAPDLCRALERSGLGPNVREDLQGLIRQQCI